MAGYKAPGFEERVAAASQARAKALAKLQQKPAVDPAVLAERAAKAAEREAAQAEKRQAQLAEREAKRLAKIEEDRLAAEAAEAAKPVPKPELTDAERKAARDARYAARKARKN